jgi:hypothetical protein
VASCQQSMCHLDEREAGFGMGPFLGEPKHHVGMPQAREPKARSMGNREGKGREMRDLKYILNTPALAIKAAGLESIIATYRAWDESVPG